MQQVTRNKSAQMKSEAIYFSDQMLKSRLFFPQASCQSESDEY